MEESSSPVTSGAEIKRGRGRPRGSGSRQRAAAALEKLPAVESVQKAVEDLPEKIADQIPEAISSVIAAEAPPEPTRDSSGRNSAEHNQNLRNPFWWLLRAR